MNHAEAVLCFPDACTQLREKHGEITRDVSGLMAAVIWKQMLARINCLSPTMKCGSEIRILVEMCIPSLALTD